MKHYLKGIKKSNVTSCAIHEDYFDLNLSRFATSLFVFEVKSHVLALNLWHWSYVSFPGGGNTGVHHYLYLLVPSFEIVWFSLLELFLYRFHLLLIVRIYVTVSVNAFI